MWNTSIGGTYVIILCILIVIWYIGFYWKRLKLYAFTANISGSNGFPLIGSALALLVPETDMVESVMSKIQTNISPAKFWIGPALFIALWKPKDVRTLFTHPDCQRRDNRAYKLLEPLVGKGLFTEDFGDKWKLHRKLMTSGLNVKDLEAFVPTFCKHSKAMMDSMTKEVGNGMFDVYDYIGASMMNISVETSIGVELNSSESSEFVRNLTRYGEIQPLRLTRVWYYPDIIFNNSPLGRQTAKVVEGYQRFINLAISRKEETRRHIAKENISMEGNLPVSLMDKMFEEYEQGINITLQDLKDELSTLIIAGFETVASTLGYISVVLGMFPEMQEKVYRELLEVVGLDQPILPEHLPKLVYMDQVIKETLRLFPPLDIVARGTDSDTKLETCTIPAGTFVPVLIMGIHRDPSIYPDPTKFDPDRFLPDEVAKRDPYSWIPFTAGPRICIGRKFAWMTMKIMIIHLLRRYIVTTNYKDVEDIKLYPGLTLKPTLGFKIAITNRIS